MTGMMNPMMMTAAGPMISSYPMAAYGSGMYNRYGRWGMGPGYGVNGSSWYNPYSYMYGSYW